MRYFKKNGQVYAFDDSQLYLITNEYVELTQAEKEAHLNPKPVQIYPPLKPRQFHRALLEADLRQVVEQAIESIEDDALKQKIKIDYQYASEFERDNELVVYMIDLLGLSSEQVTELWNKALTF